MNSVISKTLIPSISLRSSTRLTLTTNSLRHYKVHLPRLMSSESSQRLFQLKLDPLTGNSEWVVIEDNDELPECSKEPLLASTSYLDMLNDSYRNKAYRLAIDKTVTKPCHVLDIGAGTGFLSMMAARAMGFNGTVTACESYLPMAKLMRKVLHRNGMGKAINLINKRSDELKVGVDIPSRADALVSEILDSELLGEGLIPSLQHAYDKLLVENPLTVPYRAVTYGQLVESTYLWKLHDLYGIEAKASDDFQECASKSRRETEVQIKAIDDGNIHALVSWWVLQLDREGTVFYSTAPRWINSPANIGNGNWCDHWKQCVWFFRGKGMPVSGGEVLLEATHTETSVSYNLNVQVPQTDIRQYDYGVGDFQLLLSPERIATYGDSEWRLSMLAAVRNALHGRVNTLCVVVDDSIFLTLLAVNLSKTSHVVSLFPGLREKGAQYLENVAKANDFSMDRVEVPEKRKACLTLHDTHGRKVDMLIGEPYYYANEGMLPWQNLRFWKDRTLLDPVLSEDALIMPCKGRLKACAMSLPDLWSSRRCLGEVEGFDHTIVNTTLGACGELPSPKEGPCLPFSIWQCGEIKELSEIFTILEFDFSKPISSCHGKAEVQFTERGMCHGFVLWVDWVMDAENSIVVSTGPDHRYWKQGVKLLSKPVAVGINGSKSTSEIGSTVVELEALFEPLSSELIIKHAFS
ncbi:hypothetical protein V6N13_047038 [Hibiscus sabdariffa]|uniref:Protein arginine N-methyltransferase n=1 Tax=Hibiscus sabdariffa TaxID=183260 RepID=A0ABR2CAA9_9ROSI